MKRPKRRWIPRIVGVVIIAVAAWLAYEVWTWPHVSALARRAPSTTAFMTRYVERQRTAGRDTRVAHTWVPRCRPYGCHHPARLRRPASSQPAFVDPAARVRDAARRDTSGVGQLVRGTCRGPPASDDPDPHANRLQQPFGATRRVGQRVCIRPR